MKSELLSIDDPANRGQVTIREVASEAGLSIASVSDILSGTARCSYRPETVLRVRQAASRMGYRPHPMARSLRRGTTNFVGVTLGGGLPPIVGSLVAAIRPALTRRGLQPVLVDPEHLGARDPNTELLPARMLAGIISADFSLEDASARLSPAIGRQCPVVAVYPTAGTDVDCVTTDRARAIEMAVEHLVGLGHRRIAMAHRANWSHPSEDPKRLGWNRARKKHGIDPDGRCTIPVPPEIRDIALYGRYVAEALARLDPPPSAYVSTSDDYALALIGPLHGWGWRIPENLSVVGFDGVFYGRYGWPPLTTLAQPIGRIAEVAAERLEKAIAMRRAGKVAKPARILIEPEWVLRNSTIPFEAWRPFRPNKPGNGRSRRA